MKSKITNRPGTGLSLRSGIKSGKIGTNHSRIGLRVRSGIKGGKIASNHSRAGLDVTPVFSAGPA